MSGSGGSSRGVLAWGLLWASIGALALYFLAPNPWPVQGSRIPELQASLAVLNHGGPALLGYRAGTHTPYAVGYAQDQGIYLIVPVLSHWLGESNPIAMLRWLWLAAWSSTLLFSAAAFRSLFRSTWAALVASPALLVCIVSFGFGDVYWVAAWIVVTFVPVLILLTRNRPRRAWLMLMAIAFAAGVVTTIRADAGLPVALAAAAAAALVARRWPLRVLMIAAVAVAYLAPTSIVLPAVREHRDHRVGVNLSASEPTSHPLWHSLYIGLGYTSNSYGIHYLDGYGIAAAHELDPGAGFLTPAYQRALHKQVDALLEHAPGFVATAEAQKAVVELFLAAPYIVLLALLLPAALIAPGPVGLRWSELALFLPALAIGALPAIVAVPFRDYALTLLGSLGVIGLLAIGSAAAHAQANSLAPAAAGGRSRSGATRTLRSLAGTWPVRLMLLVLLLTVAILAPVALFARHLEAEHDRWESSRRSPPTVVLATAPAGRPQARA
ncbi:MAG: hypothetical protein ABSB69_02015 [Solirubrobacteraceae bacterium]